MSNTLKIAISCGDLNGIGIETLIKTFEDKRMFDFCTPILYANEKVIATLQEILSMKYDVNVIAYPEAAKDGILNIINVWKDDVSIDFGTPDSNISTYTIQSLQAATEDVIAKKADALVTLPINKDVINKNDFKHKGHTEYLREKLNVEETLMFLVSEEMRVGLVTNHYPIQEVSAQITQSAILKKVQLMHQSLQNDFGIDKPKIAVLGLNPHAGDNGLIGTEEHTTIIPALDKLTNDGIIAVGPYSADGFFGMGMHSKYDAVMAMYHDQGLLPFKMISFDQGVNYTAGLPIVRTSPDHGTAYDIAGKGIASPESLRQAIFMAVEIVNQRSQEILPS